MSPTADGSGAGPATTARLPWALLAVTVVLSVVEVPLSLGQEQLFDTVLFTLLALAFAMMGALVASRQPGNVIGWIFCGLGVSGAVVETWQVFAYHGWPTGDVGSAFVYSSWILQLAVYGLIFLLFPTGRLMTRRWRLAAWLMAAGCVVAAPAQSLDPSNTNYEGGHNPFAVPGPAVQIALYLGLLALLAGLLASVTSLVIRYRRASGVERLQLKQLVLAGGMLIVTMIVAVPFYYKSVAVQLAFGVALIALPVAGGVAILRYRLYDIDVVINRALVYGSLTATLAGAYLGSVLVLQLALSAFTEGSALAVAVSTLAVAALFRPVRGRIQGAVDRRFFRRKYDAARTLERFGAHLRDEIDLDALGGELRDVVAQTMQPAHVSLWLREGVG